MAVRKQGGLLSSITVAKVCRDSEVVDNRNEKNESVNSDQEEYDDNDDEMERD